MYILGISGGLGHDCSACLIKEGKIVAMVEEERLIRSSHAIKKMPINSIEFCLSKENITLDEVDYIALSWDKSLFTNDRKEVSEYANIHNLFPKHIFPYKKFPKVEIVNHHLAHAASTYYFSGFEESSILVVDGTGEHCSTSLFHGKDNRIQRLAYISDNQSLGEFYNAVTSFMGFQTLDAGKTMGLASFGEPLYNFERIQLCDESGYKINSKNINLFHQKAIWTKEFLKMGIKTGMPQRDYNPVTFKKHDFLNFSSDQINLAASAQKTLEECYLNLVKVLVGKTKSRNLAVAGGVALNCVANGRVLNSGLIDDMFIQPASGDAGTAIGAAAEIAVRLGYKIERIFNVYSGPSYTNDEIITSIDHLGISYQSFHDPVEQASQYLSNGYTIGWFQGASEYGPRALGNRSIIANPTVAGIRKHVNSVKFREDFRPFGPSVLEEKSSEWFDNICPSPYMLNSFTVNPAKKEMIEGVVHVDGSSRPQTVTAEANPRYYSLINSFYKKSGVPLVLNTSFNIRGQPMVCSPYDAIYTFFLSGIDILFMNEIMIKKKHIK